MPTIKRPSAKQAGGLALALALAATSISAWEGTRLDPYLDLTNVKTVCTGETRVAMRRYTAAECQAMLDKAIKQDFAPKVLQCAPSIADKPYIAAASISLSYNIGTNAFCRSTIAKRFNRGDYLGGCNAFLMWNRAGGRVVKGLENRRKDERNLCLKGV